MRLMTAVVCLALAAPAHLPRAIEASDRDDVSSFNYRKNSARISEAGLATLDYVAVDVMSNPDTVVVVDGHADEVERRDVAARRARNCRDYLVNEKGLGPDRILPRAFGDRYPIGSAEQNQRVELRVVAKGDEIATRPATVSRGARSPWSGPPRVQMRTPARPRGPRAVVQTQDRWGLSPSGAVADANARGSMGPVPLRKRKG